MGLEEILSPQKICDTMSYLSRIASEIGKNSRFVLRFSND